MSSPLDGMNVHGCFSFRSTPNRQRGFCLCGFSSQNTERKQHLCDWGFVFICVVLSVAGVFLRWNRSSRCQDEAYEEMVHIIEYNKELQSKVNKLRRQLAQLETEDRLLQTP